VLWRSWLLPEELLEPDELLFKSFVLLIEPETEASPAGVETDAPLERSAPDGSFMVSLRVESLCQLAQPTANKTTVPRIVRLFFIGNLSF
jgi:hypothetical protein